MLCAGKEYLWKMLYCRPAYLASMNVPLPNIFSFRDWDNIDVQITDVIQVLPDTFTIIDLSEIPAIFTGLKVVEACTPYPVTLEALSLSVLVYVMLRMNLPIRR